MKKSSNHTETVKKDETDEIFEDKTLEKLMDGDEEIKETKKETSET